MAGCQLFRKLSGKDLLDALSVVFHELPEGVDPSEYAMPSIKKGKIFHVDFEKLSQGSLRQLFVYFNAHAKRRGESLPFPEGLIKSMKGVESKRSMAASTASSIQRPDQRAMELGKSGLSALQAFRAVPMEGVSTGTPSSPITAATQPALGKRQRDESNETTTEAQQEGKKAKKALSNSFSEDAEAVEENRDTIGGAKEQDKASTPKHEALEKNSEPTAALKPPSEILPSESVAPVTELPESIKVPPADPFVTKGERKAPADDDKKPVKQAEAKVPSNSAVKQTPKKKGSQSNTPAKESTKPELSPVPDEKKSDKLSKTPVKKIPPAPLETDTDGGNPEFSGPMTYDEKSWCQIVLTKLRSHASAELFLAPVPEHVPKYYEIVKKPMDLRTLGEKLKGNKYERKSDFLSDLDLIVSNCKLYNQPSTVVYNICLEFEQYLKEFTNPEEVRDDPNTPGGKKRKRLAGGDHAWCIMAIETLKTHALALPFYEPVSRTITGYHRIVKRPMDFTTMTRKFERGNYESKDACVAEMRQIFANCKLFNAEGTQLHKDAKEMEVVLNQLLGNVSNRRRFTTYKMPQDDYIWCTDVLYKVRIHDLAGPFTSPVDPSFKAYFKVVKKPVDLLTMGRKLHNGNYTSKEQFCEDMQQIFTNCKLFNPDGSELREDGDKLEAYYQAMLSPGKGGDSLPSK